MIESEQQRTEDERVARAKVGRIRGDIRRLMEAHQQLEGADGPRYLQAACATAQVLELEEALVALIETDGDRGLGVAYEARRCIDGVIATAEGRSALLH